MESSKELGGRCFICMENDTDIQNALQMPCCGASYCEDHIQGEERKSVLQAFQRGCPVCRSTGCRVELHMLPDYSIKLVGQTDENNTTVMEHLKPSDRLCRYVERCCQGFALELCDMAFDPAVNTQQQLVIAQRKFGERLFEISVAFCSEKCVDTAKNSLSRVVFTNFQLDYQQADEFSPLQYNTNGKRFNMVVFKFELLANGIKKKLADIACRVKKYNGVHL